MLHYYIYSIEYIANGSISPQANNACLLYSECYNKQTSASLAQSLSIQWHKEQRLYYAMQCNAMQCNALDIYRLYGDNAGKQTKPDTMGIYLSALHWFIITTEGCWVSKDPSMSLHYLTVVATLPLCSQFLSNDGMTWEELVESGGICSWLHLTQI
jgi:hypothetical protein